MSDQDKAAYYQQVGFIARILGLLIGVFLLFTTAFAAFDNHKDLYPLILGIFFIFVSLQHHYEQQKRMLLETLIQEQRAMTKMLTERK